ncbi:MAG TPA: helix-turn-helix transcriptional regulator [Solirubrobacteraceae bacterium]|jgi:transcriptional regulator with XRE-family HTH domain
MPLSANLVAIARQRAGISQRALAARLGVPPSTVARWESAEHSPSLDTLRAVVRACGLDFVIGLANRDDSYALDIAQRLTLTPTERVRRLSTDTGDPLSLAMALYSHDVRCVLIGEIAAAAHGWPITLARGEYMVVPENAERNLARLQAAATALGATERQTEDPYSGLDTTWRWPLPGGGSLAATLQPAGTSGYRDLHRAARPTALSDAVVQLASLRDLIRIADASPRPERRAYLPALWATLEQSEDAAKPHTRAA